MKNKTFVHLHVHSEYSILQSTLRIKELVKKAHQYKMHSLAITDNSVLFGTVPFYETCKSYGIKPIIGAEVYVAPKSLKDKTPTRIRNESYSIVLLVKNEIGYKNLCTMLTIAQFEGFYYRPRVDKELLQKYSEGLICLSGNMESEIASLIIQNKLDETQDVIDFYLSVFGRDNYYLEILYHGLKQEKLVNDKLIEISKNKGVNIVACNDCKYLEREDSFSQEIARCIIKGVTINESHESLYGTEYYFKSQQEMTELFSDNEIAIQNTIKIADKCNFEMDLKTLHMPEFTPPNNESKEDFLLNLCYKGMNGKVDSESEEVKLRLNHEFKIINEMGFISYFLIVWDFINYAKNHNIPVGPGRGSAAGSLIAYLLGITNVNPLKFGLLFERFLNPARVSMPDIDIDFCYNNRSLVIEYVSKVYGYKSVAQIITFGTLAARAVIRDVGRVMGIQFSKVDQIAKMIPGEPKMTLSKAIELEPNIQELIKEDKEIEGLFDHALKLEGLPRNTSTHAAGIIISKGDLTDKVALYKGQNNEVITQFDGPTCEKIGLLKMDFLGLKTLTLLDNTFKLIRANHKNEKINNVNIIPLNDPKTFTLLNKANTLGVFQLESGGMRDLMKRLGVKEFNDIVALVALYRPGPMQMADDFIQRKHKRIKVEYFHPSLESVLKETYGVMLYQEQVMQCAQIMAGFTLADADNLRRIMGKKKEQDMKLQRDKFIEGCSKNSIDLKVAGKTFDAMEYFAGYGFNKSHSVAYGLIAYHTAWCKANYPKEFMASLLTIEANNIDKINFYIEECKAMGIPIFPPSIQYSFGKFSVEKNGIRYGLYAIKNVGTGAVDSIINSRIVEDENNKPINKTFESIEDFAKRVDNKTLNKKIMESLVKSGAFDDLETNRRYLFEITDDIIKYGSSAYKDQMIGQESFLDILDSSSNQSLTPKKKEDYPNWLEHDLLKQEKELLGCYISGHPLAQFSKVLKRFSTSNTKELHDLFDGNPIKIGGVISSLKLTKTIKTGEQMAILQLEDLFGTIEAVIYPKMFKAFEHLLIIDAPIFIQGIIQIRNERHSIVVNDIYELEKVQEKLTTALYIRIHESNDTSILKDLKNIIKKYPGSASVMLDINLTNGKTVVCKANSNLAITPSEEAIQDIEGLIGEESIWLHIKDKTKQSF